MQTWLEAQGIFPLPVVHGGDGPLDWLRQYLDEGYRFIGISRPLRRGSLSEALSSFDRIFNLVDRYREDVYLHGFAVTDVELMFRFPWFSVDSASWLRTTAYGSILMIREGRLTKIYVSKRFPQRSASARDLAWAKETVESHGFDFELMRYWTQDKMVNRRAWHERGQWNAYLMCHLRQFGARVTRPRNRISFLPTSRRTHHAH